MWFKRKHTEYGCPMCGRLPKIIKDITQTGVYLKSIYRLQCPRKHISTCWFSYPDDASRQWKQLIAEYKRKDAE